ncbi:uncharacterized protein KIAA1841 [Orussus abietinus]|uniref:uncharacterized protein KIAA1841 n=1 Tax=Orussus abietinus TaxID=222816 RepID=UPI000625A633|nr:uncharacterized protein KIAA1841 [Orussus abietinus]
MVQLAKREIDMCSYINKKMDAEDEGAETSKESSVLGSSSKSFIREGSLFDHDFSSKPAAVKDPITFHSITNSTHILSSTKVSSLSEFKTEEIATKRPVSSPRKNFDKVQHFSEDKCPELTVKMFFEFMRTAYQVNDSVEELAAIITAGSEIDWAKLVKTDLNFNSTSSISGDSLNSTANQAEEQSVEVHGNEELLMLNSSKCTSKCQGSLLMTATDKRCQKDVESPRKKANAIVEVSEETPGNSSRGQTSSKKSKFLSIENIGEYREHTLGKMVKRNLSDILHEGLLDSILPYMIPKPMFSQPVIKKSTSSVEITKTASLPSNVDNKVTISLTSGKDKDKEKNKLQQKVLENEVEIHVCDEAKNIKKDFRCPQRLLVQKMRYFADVTAGQKLEEMDISVHCDVLIFDWLMKWVKKDIIKKSEWPVLEASNVVPIMVSASFLQMEPLLESCLTYCHKNMPEVLKTPTVLTCLNDNILTRLADLFSNVDAEVLKDKKDKIQSRLFCKLIVALADPTPDNERGHFSSLATLFKCGKCGKTVIRSVSDFVPCIASATRIDNGGNLHSTHTRDLTWTLNEYVVALRTELRSWRKVYWRLWGDCHFLYCKVCGTYFPIHRMNWCSYHAEMPQFFVNEQQRSTPFPLGRYPCCSQRAYKFEALPNREGCRFKEHVSVISTDKESGILNIFALHREIISLDTPQLFFPERITRLVARDPSLPFGKLMCKEPMWWDGIELAPSRPKLGLLEKIWGGSGFRRSCQIPGATKITRKAFQQASQVTEASSPSSSIVDTDEDDITTGIGESSAEEESDNSEESHGLSLTEIRKLKRKSRYYTIKKSDGGRIWNVNLMARYNQDNQRDFEERAAVQMIALLTKRTSTECGLLPKLHFTNKQYENTWNYIQPLGGTYVRLESEFREQLVQSYKWKNSNQAKGSVRVKASKLL